MLRYGVHITSMTLLFSSVKLVVCRVYLKQNSALTHSFYFLSKIHCDLVALLHTE